VDLVFDSTYLPGSFVQSAKVLKSGGQFIVLGDVPSKDSEAAKIVAERKCTFVVADLVRYNSPSCPNEKKIYLANALTDSMKLIEEGKLVPSISNLVLLDDLPAELEAMHKGRSSPGKTVVRIRMRAVMFDEKATPAYLTYAVIPVPNDHQVLLEVIASSLNPVDWKILYYNWIGAHLPSVLGVDVAGVIRTVGKEVKDYKVGDHVVGSLNLFNVGGFAENAVVDTYRMAKIHNVPFDIAASLPVTFLSAWEAFIKPEVKKLLEDKSKKHSIFIAGGGGGVGHMAIQIAKHLGFNVISSGSRADSLKVIKTSGADHIIDYKKEDVVHAVHKVVGEHGVDMIFDSTYQASSFVQCAKVLKSGGLYVLLGSAPTSESEATKIIAEKKAHVLLADLVPISKADKTVQHEHIAVGLEAAVKLIEDKHFHPHISTVNLDDVPRALEDLKVNGSVGKVVVKVKGIH